MQAPRWNEWNRFSLDESEYQMSFIKATQALTPQKKSLRTVCQKPGCQMRTLGVCLLALKLVIFHSLKGTLILLSLLLRTSSFLLLIKGLIILIQHQSLEIHGQVCLKLGPFMYYEMTCQVALYDLAFLGISQIQTWGDQIIMSL